MTKKFILATWLFCAAAPMWAIGGGKVYQLVSASDESKCVFIKNATFDNNAEVQLWANSNVPANEWECKENSNGTYSFVNVYTGKYLYRSGSADGAGVVQSTSGVVSAAKWTVTESGGYATLSQTVSSKTLFLTATATTDGTALKMNNEMTGSDAKKQQWKLVEVSPQRQLTAAMGARMMDAYINKYTTTRNGSYQSLGTGGGWGLAEAMEIMLDAYETTGEERYITQFNKYYQWYSYCFSDGNWCKLLWNDNLKWFGHDYNDDVMWLIICMVRAYHLTGNTTYRSLAKNNFDTIWNRGYNLYGLGLMRWRQGDSEESSAATENGTNTCIDCPTIVAACYLAEALGDDDYYEKAKNLYGRWRRVLFNAATGAAYDSYNWDKESLKMSGRGTWVSTYNQGTSLGSAVMLYNRYGDEQYLKDAQKLAERTMGLCNSDGIISQNQDYGGDYCMFNGILMRYMRRYITDTRDLSYVAWMQKNAMRAYNNINSAGLGSNKWLTRTTENLKDGDSDYSGETFGNASPLSAVFNAPLDEANIVKDAYATLQAENFDYMRGIYVKDGTDDGTPEITNTKTGYYIGLSNVDFGTRTANSVVMRLSGTNGSTTACAVEVRDGSPTGTLLGTVDVPTTSGWGNVSAQITPTDGMHNIYLVFKGSGVNGNLYRLNSLTFSTDQKALPGDITDNCGLLTCSLTSGSQGNITSYGGQVTASHTSVNTGESIDKVIDGTADTKYCAGIAASDEVWMVYASPEKARLTSYSITSANDAQERDPKKWTLQGSDDGASWETIDQRENQTFANRKTTNSYNVSTSKDYGYFRLLVTERYGSGANIFQISEWTLNGEVTGTNAKYTGKTGTSALNLAYATDNKLSTYATLHAQSGYLQYVSPIPVLLKGYSVGNSIADSSNDPKSWTLQASKDGQTWKDLDRQSNKTFAGRATIQNYTINTSEEYNYFRLNITANNRGQGISVGEWQLFGKCISDDDVTSDGGTLTAASTDANDNDAATVATFGGASDIDITYKAKGKYVPYCYCLTSAQGSTAAQPAAWTFYGSTDNANWTVLDKQVGQTFPYGNSSQFYPIGTAGSYLYYKLVIDDNNGASNTELAEYQVWGGVTESATLYNDITKNGGRLTASDGTTNGLLRLLVDRDVNTTYTLPLADEAWITYQSPTPAQLYAYTVAAGFDSQLNPKAWVLEGSNDGKTWTTLHNNTSATFTSKGECRVNLVSNTSTYTYFRLRITKASGNSATSLLLGEIQLHGKCIATNDITNSGTKTVDYESNIDGEKSSMLFDNNADTKYCNNLFGDIWFNWEGSAAKANIYSITSANDEASRDPKSWQLLASNDGNTWTVLDERTDETFYNRKTTQFYGFDNQNAYSRYRLFVKGNNGADLIQLSEWQLFWNEDFATGIEATERASAISVNVYPNPVADVLYVDAPACGTLAIYDVNGRTMARQTLVAGTNSVALFGLSAGIYVVKTETGGQMATTKIVKR